jgi:hypothetical protein
MEDRYLTTWMNTAGIISDMDDEQNVRISIIAYNLKESKHKDPKSPVRKKIQLVVNATKECLESVFDAPTNTDRKALNDAVRRQYCVAIVGKQLQLLASSA